MKTLTVAQIGCGYWGPNLLRVLHECPQARVKWLCDLKPGRLAWAHQRYHGLRVTESVAEVLTDPEVGAVVLATEIVTHYRLAKAVLKAGKHVFVEKPLTKSAKEASELARLAKAKRLTLGVGHVFLYHPAVAALKAALTPKGIGRLLYVDMVRVNPGPPAPKHDVVWDMAPHDAAMAIALAGGMPTLVRGTGRRYLNSKLDEAASFELDFPRGVLARIHVSWLSSRRIRRVEVYGQKGAAFYDDVEPFDKVRVVAPGKDTRVGAKAASAKSLYYAAGDTTIPALPPGEPLKAELTDFLDSALKRRQPKSGPDMGVAVVRVLEAACKSARLGGRPVRP